MGLAYTPPRHAVKKKMDPFRDAEPALAASVFLARGRLTLEGKGRAYEVRYVWDNGVKSLQIINRETGEEETERRWRNLASGEASSFVPLPDLFRTQRAARA